MHFHLPSLSTALVAASFVGSVFAIPTPQASGSPPGGSSTSVDFAVEGPALNLGDPVAQQVIAQYTFGNSFGQPYQTTINLPPTTDFTHVYLTMETTTSGTQFDRLAKLFVNGAEIWRTSTSEPAGGEIYFTYTKDVSDYVNLFKIPNVPLTLDLGNIVNDQYTGSFNVQITAKYFNSGVYEDFSSTNSSVINSYFQRTAPNSITPIIPSGTSITSAFCWSIPQQNPSVNLPAVPRNTTRAILDIFASGNADEEFWYMNFLGNSDSPSETPARIITASIDGDPVAVTLPFPVIYTGGFAPGLWIPVVGINAYNVPSYQIDVTPYLPKLWAGATITLGIDNGLGGTCNSEWFVSANLLTWQQAGIEGSGQILKGTAHNDENTFNNPGNNSVTDLMSVARDLSTRAILSFTSADGSVNEKAFFTSTQTFSYSNAKNQYSVAGNDYYQVSQISSGYNSFKVSNAGVDLSEYINGQEGDTTAPGFTPVLTDLDNDPNLITVYENSYIYPLAMNYYPSAQSSGSYQADINRGYGYENSYTTIWTKQNGTAYTSQGSGSSISTSNVRTDQYYAQSIVELSGSTSSYDQYVASSGHQIVQNTYGDGNTDSLSDYGTTDPITTSLSAAARLAQSNGNDKAEVTAAIQNIFNNVLPPIPSSSASSKRSLIPVFGEEETDNYSQPTSFLSSILGALRLQAGLLSGTADAKTQKPVSFSSSSSSTSESSPSIYGKRGVTQSTMASKLAQYQAGWISQSTNNDDLTCWTCRTECCADCDCNGEAFMFTLQIPGRTVSKRGVRGVPVDASSPDDFEMLRRQVSAASDTITGLGRNPFFKPTASKRAYNDVQKRGAAPATNMSQWTNANLLSNDLFWADGTGLFGASSVCTTCGGSYYGGLTYSYAGSKNCTWGNACSGQS